MIKMASRQITSRAPDLPAGLPAGLGQKRASSRRRRGLGVGAMTRRQPASIQDVDADAPHEVGTGASGDLGRLPL